jgi:hypothetical protein
MAMADQSPEMIPLALGEEVLRASGEMRFVAKGSSMVPSIFSGDVLVVRRRAVGKMSRNDMVLFTQGGRCGSTHALEAATNPACVPIMKLISGTRAQGQSDLLSVLRAIPFGGADA